MPQLPTFDDLFETGKFEILRNPTRFATEIIDTDGSDVNIVVATSAAMADEIGGFAQQAFNEVHLSTAAKEGGEILDRFVWDRYQLIRFEAQQSVTTATFARPTATSPVSIPAEAIFSTEDGQTFESINETVMGTGVIGPVSATVQAQIAGELSNVEAGAINTIVTTLTDPDVTVTNLEPAAGGTQAETDDELAERARDFFINARRGTRQAIQNGSVTTPGVTQATVIEFLDDNGVANFRVQSIISDVNGQANAALATRTLDRLEEFRALGVPVLVIAGTPEFVDIVVEGLTFQAGANTTTLIDQIRAQVVSTVNQLAPGQTLERARIFTALQVRDLVNRPESALVEPAGDLQPASTSGVIRTTSSRVSINGLTGGS